MADIDHFKRVNDAHGHDTGDEVLRIIGRILRRDGLVARVGGDEFGILLPDEPALCGRARHPIGRAPRVPPARRRGQPEIIDRITLSIGVAARHAGESGGRWFARADPALYQAKRRGRNRISIARILELEF